MGRRVGRKGRERVRVGTSIIITAAQIPGVRYTARNSKNTIRAEGMPGDDNKNGEIASF